MNATIRAVIALSIAGVLGACSSSGGTRSQRDASLDAESTGAGDASNDSDAGSPDSGDGSLADQAMYGQDGEFGAADAAEEAAEEEEAGWDDHSLSDGSEESESGNEDVVSSDGDASESDVPFDSSIGEEEAAAADDGEAEASDTLGLDASDAAIGDAAPNESGPCGVLGQPCCGGVACMASLVCRDGGCGANLTLGKACSSPAECASSICTPVVNGAGCTVRDSCAFGQCCLEVNAVGTAAGVCEPYNGVPVCSGDDDCSAGQFCLSLLYGAGVCAYPPDGGWGDAGSGGIPSNVCSVTCNDVRDCVAGWSCGPQSGQSGNVCQCAASFEICNGMDDDCNGRIDDEPQADRWCSLQVGPGSTCRSGQCATVSDAGATDGASGAEAGYDATIGDATPEGGGSSGGSSSDGSGSSSEGGLPESDSGSLYDPSVYQHHKNASRNGLYVDPALTKSAAATMHAVGFMGTTSAKVYAQPLYVQNGPGGAETFIMATEGNHLIAFNASTGAVIWDQGPGTYGQPVTGGLPCGDINPLGITGTPYIDPASPINGGLGVIYFDAMTTPDNNTTAKHLVYAVKLSDGSVLPNWPVDVGASVSSFTPGWQHQRGALQLVNGVLFVPYGGLNGDCPYTTPAYYGWVVGIPVATPQSPSAWHTPGYKGGIWAPGALPSDGTSIFPVTGNTINPSTWAGGEAVLRLAATSSGPVFSGNAADYFAPDDWPQLDAYDQDLGGASDVLFDMPGAPHPHLVAAGGKDSNFYLLDRDNLGGIGGELLRQSVSTAPLTGAPAVYTTTLGTYVVFHTDQSGGATGCPWSYYKSGSLVAVRISATASGFSAAVAWCAFDSWMGSPIVTTTDGKSDAIVWDANSNLWGYDGDTGQKVFTGTSTAMSTSIQGWNTPIAIGQGRIAIAVNGQLYVFGLDPGDAGSIADGGLDQ